MAGSGAVGAAMCRPVRKTIGGAPGIARYWNSPGPAPFTTKPCVDSVLFPGSAREFLDLPNAGVKERPSRICVFAQMFPAIHAHAVLGVRSCRGADMRRR